MFNSHAPEEHTQDGRAPAGHARPPADAAPAARGEAGFDPRRDVLSSIVVFLVALPLCIGIAVAVGVSPSRALITGIIGGVVVGYLAGCPLQVSGPAAGLFVIVSDLIKTQRELFQSTLQPGASEEAATQHALTALGACVFIAGALQLAAGRLRLGQWFRAVSPAVIEGMLGGIGVLILVSQFHVMCDHDAIYHGHKAHGGWQYLATIPEAIRATFFTGRFDAKAQAGLIGVLSVVVIALWQAFAPKKLKLMPAALVAVMVAVALAAATGWNVRKLEVSSSLFTEMTFPSVATGWALLLPSVWLGGVMIAVIASAETLLCATAVDQMQNGPRTRYNKELFAHGVGNMLCGLVGALPMTGVIVRSSANVQAGAASRWSTILHGLWLLLFVVFLPALLLYIPKAALGAILVYTGFKLVKLHTLKELWKFDKGEALIFVSTLVIIVAEDLLLGVLAGLAMSAIKLLYRFSHLSSKLRVDAAHHRAHLELEGAATFIRLPQLAAELERVPPGVELHVDFTHLTHVDHACLELMTSWAKRHGATGGRLVIDWESLHARFHEDGRAIRERNARAAAKLAADRAGGGRDPASNAAEVEAHVKSGA